LPDCKPQGTIVHGKIANVNHKINFLKYLENVQRIYQQLDKTRQGDVDLEWWNALYSTESFRNGYMHTEVIRNGWIFDLFLNSDKSKMTVPQAQTNVDLKVDDVQHKLYAGFDGFTFENQTYRPHSSIIVL
jgi:hypothetical protein